MSAFDDLKNGLKKGLDNLKPEPDLKGLDTKDLDKFRDSIVGISRPKPVDIAPTFPGKVLDGVIGKVKDGFGQFGPEKAIDLLIGAYRAEPKPVIDRLGDAFTKVDLRKLTREIKDQLGTNPDPDLRDLRRDLRKLIRSM